MRHFTWIVHTICSRHSHCIRQIRIGSRGFALVELLIAVVLFGIITSMVLLTYSRVGEQLFITTLAYEAALSFRQAQSYGVSVKEFRGGGTETFEAAYGLHFESGSDKQFVLFADGNVGGNRLRYDGEHEGSGCLSASGSECVSIFKIERGNRILKFCGVLLLDGGRDVADEQKQEECNTASTPPSNPSLAITFLDVMFLRPNPDAMIRTNRSGVGERYKAARVYLASARGEKRVVEVVNTGQISIK